MQKALREILEQYLRNDPFRQMPDDDLWVAFRGASPGSPEHARSFAVLLERCGGAVLSVCRRRVRDGYSRLHAG